MENSDNNTGSKDEHKTQAQLWGFKIIPSYRNELIHTPATGRISKTGTGTRSIIKAKNFVRRDSSEHQSTISCFSLLIEVFRITNQSVIRDCS